MQKGENMFCFYVNSVFFTDHMSKTLDFNCSQRFTTVHNGSHPQLKKIYDSLYLCDVNRCEPL